MRFRACVFWLGFAACGDSTEEGDGDGASSDTATTGTAGAASADEQGTTMGDDPDGTASQTGDGSGTAAADGTTAADTGPEPTVSSSGADSSGGTAGSTGAAPTGDGGSTGDDGSTGGSTSAEGGSDSGTGDSGGSGTTGGPAKKCEPPDGVAQLPNLWVSNATEGTVSKIDTELAAEVGRYVVRPDSAGSPSRTAVSFRGDAVVANRQGGVTKIYARPEDCEDDNGEDGIQTSEDSVALAWDFEECIAWYTPFESVSNRPVAWTPGVFNEETCEFEGSHVWTSSRNVVTEVFLLDGETGIVTDAVAIPEIVSGIGLYGGAVDGEGDFWGLATNEALVRVSLTTFEVSLWSLAPGTPAYGITVDRFGRPFTCAGGEVARFDPRSDTFELSRDTGGITIGGCAADGAGTVWSVAFDNTIVGLDVDTLETIDTLVTPEYVHGVSVDFDGFVWGVPLGGSSVYRVDPADGSVVTVEGFVGLYTYSDMTGRALAGVTDTLPDR